jgi:polysaccharide biosynthesis/export protein
MRSNGCWLIVAISLLVSVRHAWSQSDASPRVGNKSEEVSAPDVTTNLPAGYILGAHDQISLIVDQLQDNFTNKTFRIDGQGDVTLPIVGRVHAGGLAASEFEDLLKTRFSTILKAPDIVVNVTEYASKSVSVMGAVNKPGVHQLTSPKTLFEVLSLSEGLRPDAGTSARITRETRDGPIPLPEATASASGHATVAAVHLKNVMSGGAENIVILPGDSIFVPKADVVYAVGNVTRPGGFPIGENETLSALQVVSLAQGMNRTAAGDKAKILRLAPGGGPRIEIPINLKLLMAGKGADMPLQPDDILFVPNSDAKSIGFRTVDAIVAAAGGLAYIARY